MRLLLENDKQTKSKQSVPSSFVIVIIYLQEPIMVLIHYQCRDSHRKSNLVIALQTMELEYLL